MSPLTRQPLLGIFRVVSFSSFVLFSWNINQIPYDLNPCFASIRIPVPFVSCLAAKKGKKTQQKMRLCSSILNHNEREREKREGGGKGCFPGGNGALKSEKAQL